MARQLGIKVIAEGVETDEPRALFAAAECDYSEGISFPRQCLLLLEHLPYCIVCTMEHQTNKMIPPKRNWLR